MCIIDQKGAIVKHKNIDATPEAFLETIKKCRKDIVVAVECMFTWYWVADLCRAEKIPFVLGHALYMKAIHGGKAKNDRIDAHTQGKGSGLESVLFFHFQALTPLPP